jgi:hypothetical protein
MATVSYTVIEGEIISENRGGTERDYVPDPLGSTVALLDSTQTKTDTFAYWPYGEERSRVGTAATPFRFVGTSGYSRHSDSHIYVRARYLGCTSARWRTVDPYHMHKRAGLSNSRTASRDSLNAGRRASYLTVALTSTRIINNFAYSVNSPTNHVDPSGLDVPIIDPFPPNHTHYCGWTRCESQYAPVDCIDIVCRDHDYCVGSSLLSPILFIPCSIRACAAATHCVAAGCWSAPDPLKCFYIAIQVRAAMCFIAGIVLPPGVQVPPVAP